MWQNHSHSMWCTFIIIPARSGFIPIKNFSVNTKYTSFWPLVHKFVLQHNYVFFRLLTTTAGRFVKICRLPHIPIPDTYLLQMAQRIVSFVTVFCVKSGLQIIRRFQNFTLSFYFYFFSKVQMFYELSQYQYQYQYQQGFRRIAAPHHPTHR